MRPLTLLLWLFTSWRGCPGDYSDIACQRSFLSRRCNADVPESKGTSAFASRITFRTYPAVGRWRVECLRRWVFRGVNIIMNWLDSGTPRHARSNPYWTPNYNKNACVTLAEFITRLGLEHWLNMSSTVTVSDWKQLILVHETMKQVVMLKAVHSVSIRADLANSSGLGLHPLSSLTRPWRHYYCDAVDFVTTLLWLGMKQKLKWIQ